MENEYIIQAHSFSVNNKQELIKDQKCGCFYCLEIFNSREIVQWLNEKNGTALCPYCMIDSVIGESSGYPISKEFLEEMREYWF